MNDAVAIKIDWRCAVGHRYYFSTGLRLQALVAYGEDQGRSELNHWRSQSCRPNRVFSSDKH
jgi:hypothetical protein